MGYSLVMALAWFPAPLEHVGDGCGLAWVPGYMCHSSVAGKRQSSLITPP